MVIAAGCGWSPPPGPHATGTGDAELPRGSLPRSQESLRAARAHAHRAGDAVSEATGKGSAANGSERPRAGAFSLRSPWML